MRGLQSHSFTDKRWVPPKGRFAQLEKSDEQWASALGLGHYEESPTGLFDVRTFDNTLAGYTYEDPSKCMREYFEIRIRSEDDLFPLRRSDKSKLTFTTLTITCQVMVVCGERFLCWICKPQDAVTLIRSNFITCVGMDRIKELEYKLYREQHENIYRYG